MAGLSSCKRDLAHETEHVLQTNSIKKQYITGWGAVWDEEVEHRRFLGQ